MRISELARESGTSVATIKYYLREGLLAPGERVNAREASYGQGHVKRLRLVRERFFERRTTTIATPSLRCRRRRRLCRR